MIAIFGVPKFLLLYVLSGVGCAASSLYSKLKFFGNHCKVPPPTLGASGCIAGVVTSYVLTKPTSPVTLVFTSLPIWIPFGGFVVYDLFHALTNDESDIDSAGHLGGKMSGLLWYLLLRLANRF
jgi:membrane associated rhomboid family serine protease